MFFVKFDDPITSYRLLAVLLLNYIILAARCGMWW